MKNSTQTIKLSNNNDIFSNADIDTENGFAHIVTEDELTIQCCLVERVDYNGYKKEIDVFDCGENDGICGDVNRAAFEIYGKDQCMDALFYQMRKIGVVVKK